MQVTGKAFYLETFGCQMNAHDSEKVVGTLLAKGYNQVETPEAADLVLYNTCSIRDRKSTRLNSSHLVISYAVLCLKKERLQFLHHRWQGLVLQEQGEDRPHPFRLLRVDCQTLFFFIQVAAQHRPPPSPPALASRG